jgi:tetratricopeptide (TPR) repeat protein/uncharacterized caspase-like protein
LILVLNRFGILLISLVLLQQAVAQPDERGLKKTGDSSTQKGTTYAIIIGISQYKAVPSLQFAHKDAQAFEDFLLTEAGGRTPRINIETFLNENATRNNVADAISIIARKAKTGDRVYFFFAGHGDMEDLTQIENGLLLLYNCPNGNYFGMKDDVLEILDLKRYLSPLAQRGVEMIFIVDACHSGNLKGGVEGVQQTASALAAAWGKEYKILSCQPNQLSLESAEWGGGRGLFSLQLEEGMKGLADKNNDGKVSFSELQRYITDNVATYSEEKQIPLLMGDLSKSFVNVNPAVLAALKIQKAKDRPALAMVNPKGTEEKYIDSLTPTGKKIYLSYKKNLSDKKLIWPKDTNALKDYRAFEKKFADNPLTPLMRRNLAAALNQRFDSIVSPLLRGGTSYSSREECYYAAMELDSCLHLLGEQHYMYHNLKARKLFMDAMSLTWALSENEYNISWRPTVLESIKLLEESAELEPNAAYALSALGIHYTFIYEYDKANQVFQRYLDLRPNDLSAKFSLGLIYAKLKQFDKSENLFEGLLKTYPDDVNIKLQLSDLYWNNNKIQQSLILIDQMIASENNKMVGYFSKGLYYSRANKPDSAVYFYNQAKKYFNGYCSICDNNIGHIYFVNNQVDSARKYFLQVLAQDSTYPFAQFNMGVIEQKEVKPSDAIKRFYSTILHSTASTDGFITNLQLYFGKTYQIINQKEFNEFRQKSHTLNMQYLSFLYILYTYIRIPGLIDNTENTTYLFDQLFNYKQHEVLTWYHHGCYKALKQDKNGALESLENSLRLGFGNYFMLTSDNDLSFIRNTSEFKLLLKKYFPDKVN